MNVMYDLRIPTRFQEGQEYQEYVRAQLKTYSSFTPYTHVPMEVFYRLSGTEPLTITSVRRHETEPVYNGNSAGTGESEHVEDTLVFDSVDMGEDTLIPDSVSDDSDLGCGLCNAEMKRNKPFSWADVDIPEDAYQITYQFAERKGAHAFLGYAYFTAEGEHVEVEVSELCDEHAPRNEASGLGLGKFESEATAVAEAMTESSTENDDEGQSSNKAPGRIEVDGNGSGNKHWHGTWDSGPVGDKMPNSTAAKVTEQDSVENWQRRTQAWATVTPGSETIRRRRRQPKSHW